MRFILVVFQWKIHATLKWPLNATVFLSLKLETGKLENMAKGRTNNK